jgi:hypothetical protein
MHAYMIEEMADAISRKLHIDTNEVLCVLHHYWEDKIALVWQVEDMLNAALNDGTPITQVDAGALLYNMLDDHDPNIGISWETLSIELQEYHLNLKRLPEDQYNEVQGVFKVWRQGNPIAHQIGLFPDMVHDNLPKAITLAKSMADENPNIPILIGCEACRPRDVEPWLSVTRVNDNLLIEQKEQSCTP